MFCKPCIFSVLLAALAVASTANAAPPLKHTAWVKITAAYATQAKAHGSKATCTPWDSTGIHQMQCDFGAKGRATIDYVGQPCTYAVTVYFPKPRFPLYEHAELSYCGAKWWTKPLPAPWTFR